MGVGRIQRNQQAWWSTLRLATAELSPALGEGGSRGAEVAGTWELWPPERAASSRKASRENRHANHWLLQPSDHLGLNLARSQETRVCPVQSTQDTEQIWGSKQIHQYSIQPSQAEFGIFNKQVGSYSFQKEKKKVVPFHLFLVGSASCIIDNNCHMSGTEPDAFLLVIVCNLILIITVS